MPLCAGVTLGMLRDFEALHWAVFVSNRPGAVEWLKNVWSSQPVAEDHETSLFIFGSTQLVINHVDADTPSTIAFTSDD